MSDMAVENTYGYIQGATLPGEWMPLREQAEQGVGLLGEVPLSEDIIARLINPLGPYAPEHALTVPIRKNRAAPNVVEVSDLTTGELAGILRLNQSLMAVVAGIPGVARVNMGYNYAIEDSKIRRRHKSAPEQEHFHLLGYGKQDIHTEYTRLELARHPEWVTSTADPFWKVGHDILKWQVLDKVRHAFPDFKTLFHEIDVPGKGVTYRFIQGLEGLSNPALAPIVQALHLQAKQAYQELAGCYCLEENGQFLINESELERYVLRDPAARVSRVRSYLDAHPTLSRPTARKLLWLARTIVDEDQAVSQANRTSIQRRLGSNATADQIQRNAINTRVLMKGLAYTMIWSLEGGEVRFGMDASALAAGGLPAADRFADLLYTRGKEPFTGEKQVRSENFQEKMKDAVEAYLAPAA